MFQTCAAEGRTRILLCGVSELAEIASLRAREHGITLLGTYDPRHAETRFLDLPVWQRVEDLPPCDFYVVTQLDGITEFVEALGQALPRARILTPALLKVAPPSASLGIPAHRVTMRGHGAGDAPKGAIRSKKNKKTRHLGEYGTASSGANDWLVVFRIQEHELHEHHRFDSIYRSKNTAKPASAPD